MPERSYELNIKIKGKMVQARLKVTSKFGSEVLKEVALCAGENLVKFELIEKKENMEFFIQNVGESLEIESIRLNGDILQRDLG